MHRSFASGSSGSASSSSRESIEFESFLRSIRSRAQEAAATLANIESTIAETSTPIQWTPTLLAQFILLQKQMMALEEQIHTNPAHGLSRSLSQRSLVHPLTSNYNPAIQLRVKPLPELEATVEENIRQFARNHSNLFQMEPLEAAKTLCDTINEYNAQITRLSASCQRVTPSPISPQTETKQQPPWPIQSSSAFSSNPSSASVDVPSASSSPSLPNIKTSPSPAIDEEEVMKALRSLFAGKILRRD